MFENLTAHLLSGLGFGMLLFVVASGLTVSFGLMGSVNLAHGAFFMIGGYLGISILNSTGNYALALAVGVVVAGLGGMLVQKFLLQRIQGQHLPQIVLTIGVALIIQDAIQWRWSAQPLALPNPPLLSGTALLFGLPFPRYRLGLIVLGGLVALFLALVLERTRVGAMVRAAVDDQEMARAVGINVPLLLMLVFGLASALAAFAGLWGGAFTGLHIGLGFDMVLLAFIVIVLGGVGSLRGALLASLYVGLVNQFGTAFFPDLSQFAIYAPAALVLAVRPQGFFGRA